MGLPMIQVFMIMARQMSKPVADLVMRYGKNHPLFRIKVLIPVGRGLANLTTRLRMKNLGLGAPTTIAKVSETVALEQASEFVQQVVIFGYTVGVFYAYQSYSKANEIATATKKELNELNNCINVQLIELNQKIDQLNTELKMIAAPQKSQSLWKFFFGSKNDSSSQIIRRNSEPIVFSPTITREEAMRKISSKSFESIT